MSDTRVKVTLAKGASTAVVEGLRIGFSPYRCFLFDHGEDDIACLRVLGQWVNGLPNPVFVGSSRFAEYFFEHVPEVRSVFLKVLIYGQRQVDGTEGHGLASVDFDPYLLPEGVGSVFLGDTLANSRMQVRRLLPAGLQVVDPTELAVSASEAVPARAWIPLVRNIYPIDIPEIRVQAGLDFVIVDSPSRNLALMPNGLAYLNNALKKTTVSFQILDLDIIAYHRFHVHRLFDVGDEITLPGGLVLPEDPWKAEHYDLWTRAGGGASGATGRNEVLHFFRPLLDETIAEIVRARPKALGLSIQGCNEAAAQDIAMGVKAALPDTIIVVGGFSCYNADIGRRAFPECDYMCIGEADLTVGPLLEALARGERPFDQPGVLSRFDTPDYRYIPAPMIHDLDTIEFPKYEWTDLSIYRNFNDYQLTPIIASRGCRWSRCSFCAERFYWRIRTAANFVDELEWLIDRGCHLFMFNESDLGGMPERVVEICEEIIRRGLHRKAKLTGQLRVNKKQDRRFFEKLREANFVALRFGIDAFSERTLRLQKKGYTVEMVTQNLKDCWEVGIFTEVNWVIGVPGETEQDVEEGIELILKNRNHIGRLANINPLILVNGGVYWIDPAAHNIVFKEPKDELYAKYPRALPADKWYSTHPYIDAQVRKERFERIVVALHDAGFGVGAWANRIIEDVKYARDKMRTSGAAASASGSGEFEIRDEQESAQACELPLALESADASGAGQGEAGRGGKVIPIRSPGESRATRPAATPPLHGIAGSAPKLVRQTETHKIVFSDGWYYGIPVALAERDLAVIDFARLPGVIRFTQEAEVVSALEEAARWANLRGQYDDQQKQRVSGSYLRADSVGESVGRTKPIHKSLILRFKDGYVALDAAEVASAFQAVPQQGRRGRDPAPRLARPPVAAGSSLARRLANRLPLALFERLRALARQQAFTDGTASRPTSARSDRQLALMVWRAAVDQYARRPLARLKAAALGLGSNRRSAEVQRTDEAALRVLSALTIGAQPELMFTIGSYNIVKFDGAYYGAPHGTSIDWDRADLLSIPGILFGATVSEVVGLIEQRNGVRTSAKPGAQVATVGAREAAKGPMFLGAMTTERYNLVEYEGWVYGLPHDLGEVDLTKVDVMEMPGVIRDVSRDAVESEITSRSKEQMQAA